MDIAWKTEKLRAQVMRYAQSNPITERRMISIKAAKNFNDLTFPGTGRAHFLQGRLRGLFAIDLGKKGNGKRLICAPDGNFQIKNGIYVKESITKFVVIRIEDYH